MKAALVAAAALLAASSARAQLPADLGAVLQRTGTLDGSAPGAAPAAVPPAVGVAVGEDGTPLTPEEQRTNFSYGEISNKLKKVVIGHGRHKRPANNGVTPADRVERGEIKYIVVHSAMGTCDGAINQMEHHHAAAHFMVCEGGDVTRLVDIKNIALHVKNKDINAASVGIETETGFDGETERFTDADWDPDLKWRMYASLAWLIRAVAEEAHVPRDEAHIIGHYDADLGIPDAHTDPGPLFYSKVYPAFEARFPGQNVTPRKFLMMLVNDDVPPVIRRVPATNALRVSEPTKTGVKKVLLYKLGGAKPVLDRQWVASESGGLPPASMDLTIPTDPGAYRVEAYDLVGNKTAARFTVDAVAGGSFKIQMERAYAP